MRKDSDRYDKMEYTIIRILQLGCLLIVGVRILAEELSTGNPSFLHLIEIIRQAHICP
jgi:hypothetical protein